MTSYQRRFLIDECLSPDLIKSYLKPHIEVRGDAVELFHWTKRFGEKKKQDTLWVPELAKDRRWVVVSGDSGKRCPKLESMRRICREYRVTLVYAASAVRRASLAYYGPQFQTQWAAILEAVAGPTGGQYILRMASQDHSRTILEAMECPTGYRPDGAACRSIEPLAVVHTGEPVSLSRGQRRKGGNKPA